MIRIPQPVQYVINFLTFSILPIIVLLSVWKSSNNLIPLPIYFEITSSLITVSCVSYWLIFPALLLSNFKIWKRVLLGVLAIVVFPFFIVLILQSGHRIINSIKIGERNIYLARVLYAEDTKMVYLLYDCNAHDLDCNEVKDMDFEGGTDLYKTELVTDNDNIHVFANGYLEFTYGKESKNYDSTFADRVTLGKYDYDIAVTRYVEPATIVLYRIRSDSRTDAEVLPFQYTTNKYNDIELKVNRETEEVSIYLGNQLIYKYGSTPQCFVINCVNLSN